MPRHRFPRALLALVAGLALLVLVAGPAAAHDEVVATTPAADERVPRAPSTVEVEVNTPPQVLGTEVRVTGPDGSLVSEGPVEVLGSTVRQPLADGLAAGAYTVEWRVTSGDGHPITGASGFTVTQGAPSSSATPSSATAPPSAADEATAAPGTGTAVEETSTTRPAESSSSTGLVVGGASVVLGLGGLVAWRLRRRA